MRNLLFINLAFAESHTVLCKIEKWPKKDFENFTLNRAMFKLVQVSHKYIHVATCEQHFFSMILIVKCLLENKAALLC